MPSKRLELTVSQELWDRMEGARGDVPRARWVKMALEAFLAPKPPEIDARVVAEEVRAAQLAVSERSPRVQAVRPQFVRASTLVTPEIKSEWAEIMAARQARLNRKRDGDAA